MGSFFFGALQVIAQPSPEQLRPIREYFLYEVHYGPFRLGFVEIHPVVDTVYAGIPALKYKMVMRSNPKLLFLGNKREHYYSVFAEKGDKTYGLEFLSDDIDSEIMKEILMVTDTLSKAVHIEFRPEKDEFYQKELPWAPYSLLGPDIYYFSRLFAGKDTLIKSPIYVDTTLQEIALRYESRPEKRHYLAFPDSVETVKLYGDAPFTGPFGFNGKFYAWYGTDSLRIPLEAHADVWIGAVKVKLIEYKRNEK
jgi:hypothetical protein